MHLLFWIFILIFATPRICLAEEAAEAPPEPGSSSAFPSIFEGYRTTFEGGIDLMTGETDNSFVGQRITFGGVSLGGAEGSLRTHAFIQIHNIKDKTQSLGGVETTFSLTTYRFGWGYHYYPFSNVAWRPYLGIQGVAGTSGLNCKPALAGNDAYIRTPFFGYRIDAGLEIGGKEPKDFYLRIFTASQTLASAVLGLGALSYSSFQAGAGVAF